MYCHGAPAAHASTTCPPGAAAHVSTCAWLHAPSTAHISALPTRGSRQYTSANDGAVRGASAAHASARRSAAWRSSARPAISSESAAVSASSAAPGLPHAQQWRSGWLNCAPSAHSDPGRAPPSAHHWLYAAQVAPLPLSKVASSTQSSIGARRAEEQLEVARCAENS